MRITLRAHHEHITVNQTHLQLSKSFPLKIKNKNKTIITKDFFFFFGENVYHDFIPPYHKFSHTHTHIYSLILILRDKANN